MGLFLINLYESQKFWNIKRTIQKRYSRKAIKRPEEQGAETLYYDYMT